MDNKKASCALRPLLISNLSFFKAMQNPLITNVLFPGILSLTVEEALNLSAFCYEQKEQLSSMSLIASSAKISRKSCFSMLVPPLSKPVRFKKSFRRIAHSLSCRSFQFVSINDREYQLKTKFDVNGVQITQTMRNLSC